MTEIKDPDAPATTRQRIALARETGVDARGLTLTKGDASDLLDMVSADHPEDAREALIRLGGRIRGPLPPDDYVRVLYVLGRPTLRLPRSTRLPWDDDAVLTVTVVGEELVIRRRADGAR